jgi:hypothetical protein
LEFGGLFSFLFDGRVGSTRFDVVDTVEVSVKTDVVSDDAGQAQEFGLSTLRKRR